MAAVKTVSLTKEYSNGEEQLMIYLSQLKKMNL